MKTKNMLLIKFSLYIYGCGEIPHPRDIDTPSNVIEQWWVPQSMSDSIWIFYEFKDFKSKEGFMSNHSEVFKNASIRNENNKFINKWIRNKS